MKTLISIFLLLTSITATAQSTVAVDVPPGDLDALRQAMNVASEGDPSTLTIIYTSGTFNFSDSIGLPDIHSQVLINGDSDPIIFQNAGGYARPFVTISEAGWLQLRNIEIKDFNLTGAGSFIVNQGKLDLELVQFDSVNGSPVCGLGMCSPNPTIFDNSASGQLRFYRVSLINSGVRAGAFLAFNQDGLIRNHGSVDIQDTQIYLGSDNWSIPIMNSGLLSLKNVSMFHSNYDGQFKNVPMKTLSGAETYVSNSIISGFSGAWCDNATSVGNNHIDNDQCNFNANGDVIGEPTGLLWREIGDDLRSGWHSSSGNPILKYALVPVATSLAVDSIDPPELCTSHDLLQQYRYRGSDGNGDGISACDKGAVEAQPVYIAGGGINGVYYNPEADGHYITIIDNPYNTLVMWNSFDKDGNQYFVHGTGELVADRSLVADAYIHVSGSTSSGGEIVPAQELHWGTLEVEMTSCNEGILAFNSDFPEVGSGQVRLQRLVFVKQLGCVD